MPDLFTLHRPVEDDWREVRELRMRAITDTPIAFLESIEIVSALSESDWRQRITRNREHNNRQCVAVARDGRWVGSMIVFVSDGPPPYLQRPEPGAPRANLVGVFVDPKWRGENGVTDAILGELARWTLEDRGIDRLHLHVSEHNPRAQRAYEKRGFRTTGVVEKIPGDDDGLEIEMVVDLPLPGIVTG